MTKEARESADARFDRIQKVVTNQTESERLAMRTKTAALKALRLETKAAEKEPTPPARKKTRA